MTLAALILFGGSGVAAVTITRSVETHTAQQASVASGRIQVSVPEPAAATS